MFELDKNGVVKIKADLLLIKAFKELYDSDKQEKINKLFAYIYFKHDFKSPYKKQYTSEQIEKALLVDILEVKAFKPNKLLIAAEKKYVELQQTKSLKTLASAERALNQIDIYFESIDIMNIPEDKRDAAAKNIMTNIKEIDEVTARMESARRRVEQELSIKILSGKKKLGKRELPKDKR